MSASPITSIPSAIPILRTPEGKEGPGPDHDKDGDDKSVGAATISPPAAIPAGMGAVVNTKA